MTTYRHGSHTVFSIHLHVVWITKYRKKVLTESVALRVRDMIRETCQREGVDIIKGHVSKDHIHLFLSIPPQVTISRLVQKLKGKTSFKLMNEFPHLRKTFWGRHFWARGYFCCSSGNVTDEMIIEYIETQDASSDDNFKVEGDGEKSA
ncbi:IS200/IS605 family transposase [Desulfofustis limnaeus]|jgi:putative transposase|uniref:IS200/IS605 family transposase n=1 Tax=Desulfofustis limnaeus TaxID=2740163 RepID=A0ABN6MCB8_9BACT|nr:IS200/IS605 family transposase [Desulfofustis limnaeus]MDX9894851.1 IS200/IS605 family transposase [Desulfofustis sp.]BDD85841.1 IS200/IS605 family transposase [Desulfofustis limnaeus]BDD87958.1 IS200/IS605 family transposase [Desulfofustis limnaeus]BDD87996.1 IS200/IS605 family transposase [Desulfofustis limnaeus]BDD88830.1 IS200/IS605 family transposase [Desulfofustis limnaeus]